MYDGGLIRRNLKLQVSFWKTCKTLLLFGFFLGVISLDLLSELSEIESKS